MNDTAPELHAGDPAPGFSLQSDSGTTVNLTDYAGRRVIVYFYPAAFTPGCTTEACDFRDSLASLRGAGYEVIGISGDDTATLARFAAEDAAGITLLSDPEQATARAWGAWGEKTINGNTVIGALRSTFVIDENGAVNHAEYRVDPTGHVRRLRELLGA